MKIEKGYKVVVKRVGGVFSSLNRSYIYCPGAWTKRRQGDGALGVFKNLNDAISFCHCPFLPYTSVIYECEYTKSKDRGFWRFNRESELTGQRDESKEDEFTVAVGGSQPEGTDFADSVLLTEKVQNVWSRNDD